jgi:FkbM family methyltransferase
LEINIKNFQITDTIHGTMACLKNDAVLGQWLKKYGEWSQGENIIMSNFVSKGDIVIDIGANIGTTVLSLSKQVSSEGKVLAFEPQSLMAQCLQTNLTLNDITNVVVDSAAVSNKNGWTFLNDATFSGIGRYGEAGISDTGTRIKTIKLDEVEVPKCSLIKIDVESYEWEVIQGGQKFLRKHKPVLYMEAKNNVDGTKKYLKWLFDNGWRCYWHFAYWFRKNNYKNNSNDLKQGTGDMNILAVPSKDSQPNDLLELSSYDEDWDQNKLIDFYNSNNLPMI